MMVLDDFTCAILNITINVDIKITDFVLKNRAFNYRRLSRHLQQAKLFDAFVNDDVFAELSAKRIEDLSSVLKMPFDSVRAIDTRTGRIVFVEAPGKTYEKAYGFCWEVLQKNAELIAPINHNHRIVNTLFDRCGPKIKSHVICVDCYGNRTVELVKASRKGQLIYASTEIIEIIPASCFDH